MNSDDHWIWLTEIKNIWQPQIKALLKVFGSPKEIYEAEDKHILELNFLLEEEKNEILKAKKLRDIGLAKERLNKKGINFLSMEDPSFPPQLKNIKDAPYAIYYKGRLPDIRKYSVGIVGGRICSEYGKRATAEYSAKLAINDVQIISGMAMGIDAEASKAALRAGGSTFVVLGTGVDVPYPSQNTELYYEILMNGGGVISEYPPGSHGNPWQFPHRNRLISALSDKVIIVEAKKRSGTLTTAQHAIEQNVDVYALPGRIYDRLSEGSNRMIADGCGILIDSADFMSDLYSRAPKCIYYDGTGCGISQSTISERSNKTVTIDKNTASDNDNEKALSGNEKMKKLYSLFDEYHQSADDLINRSSMSAEDVSTTLIDLQLNGLIKEISKDIYIKI